jgi:superfamily I DNA/RNA helicase
MIDEFQDLTEIEARLVLGLRAENGKVVALGDRKQSIYAFRGNEGRGLDILPELTTGAVIDHPMDECQRCPSEIVLLANDVMAFYGEPLQDVRGAGGQLHQVYFHTPEAEKKRMAAEIIRVARARPLEVNFSESIRENNNANLARTASLYLLVDNRRPCRSGHHA